jgi:hypothetical protein
MQFKEVLLTAESDGKVNANAFRNIVANRRAGKFKLSEAQFVEIATTIWCQAEFSALERILRCMELNKDHTKNEIIGEIHLILLNNYDILKKRMGISGDLKLEDFLPDGKYSTDRIEKEILKIETRTS